MTQLELYNKYPKIFNLLLTDGFYSISSYIPEGWINIVDNMCECIQKYIDNININNKHLPKVQQVVCEQIKEKYAELRFYYHGGDNIIEGIIKFAELLASKTCQECGKEGKIINNKGWYTILCDNCNN